MSAGAFRTVLLVLPVLVMGCAGGLTYDDPLPPETPSRAAVADVPLIEQEDFFCGPASLAMVFQWGGLEVSQDEVAALSFTPGAKGTFQSDMIGAARRSGRLAVEIDSFPDLLDEVSAGHPVVVFQNLGIKIFPQWHYGVVTGFDRTREEMYLNSGQLSKLTMPFPLFERTWRRGDYWGLVVLPPGDLPETADDWAVLRAAAALERTGRLAEAEAVYRSGADRWRGNWLWPFGLGNALYAQGRYAEAVTAYRSALALEPSVPEIQTNLASARQALAGRGSG